MSRTCGECTLCCKVLGVGELNKPSGRQCDLVQIGKGCGDYENRPQSCHDFECLWLVSTIMPDTMRPDRTKAVFTLTKDDKVVVYVDASTPDHITNTFELRALVVYLSRKHEVVIVCAADENVTFWNPPTKVCNVTP
jgi:uncharacterized protein